MYFYTKSASSKSAVINIRALETNPNNMHCTANESDITAIVSPIARIREQQSTSDSARKDFIFLQAVFSSNLHLSSQSWDFCDFNTRHIEIFLRSEKSMPRNTKISEQILSLCSKLN